MALERQLYENLAVGHIPNASAALYTVPSGIVHPVTVPLILLYNGHNAPLLVTLTLLKASGGHCVLDSTTIAAGAKREIEYEALSLGAGDSIMGVTTVAAVVDYGLFGAWQTPE